MLLKVFLLQLAVVALQTCPVTSAGPFCPELFGGKAYILQGVELAQLLVPGRLFSYLRVSLGYQTLENCSILLCNNCILLFTIQKGLFCSFEAKLLDVNLVWSQTLIYTMYMAQ